LPQRKPCAQQNPDGEGIRQRNKKTFRAVHRRFLAIFIRGLCIKVGLIEYPSPQEGRGIIVEAFAR
jgi:hypothetical protein